jgi:hypothetical protein
MKSNCLTVYEFVVKMSFIISGELNPQNGVLGDGRVTLQKFQVSPPFHERKIRYEWRQRRACDNTWHLARDYGDISFEKVMEWLPCDWLNYRVEVVEKEIEEIVEPESEEEEEDDDSGWESENSECFYVD